MSIVLARGDSEFANVPLVNKSMQSRSMHRVLLNPSRNYLLLLKLQPIDMRWSLAAVCVLGAMLTREGLGQPSVCGKSCQSDVQCSDSRAICTYCTK